MEELGIVESELIDWKYCGGNEGSHRKYFELVFPERNFPGHRTKCVCG